MKNMLLTVGFVLVGGIALTIAVRHSRHPAAPAPATPQLPVGHEQPIPGATFVNGYNVANIGPCTFQDRYAEAGALLGPPVGSFTGRTQDFLFGRLVCAPHNPPENRVRFDDLGLAYLRLRGLTPRPGAEPHPAVRSHILGALETGLDPQEFFGRVISPPLCDRTGQCAQYTDKQRLEFADAPDAPVSWAPLGCLLNHACQQAGAAVTRDATAHANHLLVATTAALGLAALLAGLALVLRRRLGGRGFAATI
jgi:hypothetical protein